MPTRHPRSAGRHQFSGTGDGPRTDYEDDGHQDPAPAEDPWTIEGIPQNVDDCGCKPAPPSNSPVRPNPVDAKPKGNDCCQQILDILQCIPGIDQKCLHVRKPKTPPKVKVANLCGVLPIKERIGPMMLLILRRLRSGVTAANAFERDSRQFLATLPAKQRAALEAALDGYDALPAARRDCVFETRFDSWPDETPLDADFFRRNIESEIVALGRFVRFGPEAPPFPTAGSVRPWTQTFPVAGEPGKFANVLGPWPWICAISPIGHRAIDETGWYRNESSCTPGNVPRGTINYFPHEFSWNCTRATPGGPLDCRHVEPSGGGAGGFGGFARCNGGEDYRILDKATSRQVCLGIPLLDPGVEVGLRGLNFFTRNAEVRIRKDDNPVFRDIPPIPISDWQPDTSTPAGVSTCAVRDFAYFNMPTTVKDGLNDVPIPPGRYAIQIVFKNDINYPVVAGEPLPTEFASNEILVELQPSPNQRYQILIDEAGCDEETDGIGSDEPWFRAIAATAELAKAETTVQFTELSRVDIITAEDVDSGESISFPPASLFNDTLGRKVLAIAIIGLEVDSESAAREQIDSFFDAYVSYLKNLLVVTGLTISGGGGVLAGFLAGARSPGAVGGGIAFGAILAGGFLYAAWAPADPIAIDFLTYTARELFEMTDANPGHIPEPTWNRVHQLRMSSSSLGKQLVAGGQAATYSEKRYYHSTWENSRYNLTYRFKRT